MIGAKLGDQKNSKHASRFKFTIQCSNLPCQSTAVQNQAKRLRYKLFCLSVYKNKAKIVDYALFTQWNIVGKAPSVSTNQHLAILSSMF